MRALLAALCAPLVLAAAPIASTDAGERTAASEPTEAPAWRTAFLTARPQGSDLEPREMEELLTACATDEALRGSLQTRTPLERFRLGQRLLLLAAGLPEHRDSLRAIAPEWAKKEAPRLAALRAGGHPALQRAAKRALGCVRRIEDGLREELTSEERRSVLSEGSRLLAPPLELSEPLAVYDYLSENDRLVDAVLGMRYAKVESTLPRGAAARKRYGKAETYIDWNLPESALLTSYVDLERIFRLLEPKPGQTLVDLGSGYGRVGFYLVARVPGTRFVGYEIVHERVVESDRMLRGLGLTGVTFEEADLTAPDFALAPADWYFAYDPVHRETRARLLEKLRLLGGERPFKLVAVEGQGEFLETLRRQSWLREVAALPSVRPLQFPILVFEPVAASVRDAGGEGAGAP